MAVKTIRSKPIDVSKISETVKALDRQIVYLNSALYPVLQMQVRLREKCRDDMGDLEVAVLRLCAAGVATGDQFAFSMGVSSQRIVPVLSEMAARGLVRERRRNSGEFELTELGELSLQHGCEVIQTDRAVLVCGITGRLLPKAFYSLTAISMQEIRSSRFVPDMIQEAAEIPLSGLRLESIANRKAVNLPEETIAIEGVVQGSIEPRFIPCHIVIHQGNGAVATELHVMGGVVDWLDVKSVLGMLEPLGYPDHTVDGALGLIMESFKDKSAEIAYRSVDRFGNPVLELAGKAEGVLAQNFSGRSLAFSIGVNEFQPLPIGMCTHKITVGTTVKNVDLLKGRTMVLKAQPESELGRMVSCLRSMELYQRDYNAKLRRGELSLGTSMFEYLSVELSRIGVTVEQAMHTAQLAKDTRLIKALEAPEAWK